MADEGEWDEWGDDLGAPHATSDADDAVSVASSYAPVSAASSAVSTASQDALEPPRELLDWRWDLDELDAELATLVPSQVSLPTTAEDQEQPQHRELYALASLAGPTRERLRELGERTRAMRAQTAVAQWKLRRLERGLTAPTTPVEDDEQLMAIEDVLVELAGEWARVPRNEEGEDTEAAHAQLREMSSLLQHALAACEDGDATPFQQALEQLFGSLPDQKLVIPTSWIRPTPIAATDEETSPSMDAFVARLVALCSEDDDESEDGKATKKSHANRVRPLADAQVFQDTKDIQRDELIVDGEHVVGGAVGYDAVITTIENHLRHTIAHAAVPTDGMEGMLRLAAQQVLTACNRTESGGSSYEILSQFVTQHSTERVLIRPASAKAPPLEIASDVGAFATRDAGWCFGLRVRVSAVTWYCICDADDPTSELYDVETTYMNRLAFPLGMTALAPRDFIRRDGGDVVIALRVQENGMPDSVDDVDFDGLM